MAARKKQVIVILSVALVVFMGFYLCQNFFSVQKVDLAEVEKGSVESYIKGRGEIVSDNYSVVLAKTPLRVCSLPFKEGDVVSKGEILIETDLNSGDLEVNSLREKANSISAGLREARRTAEDFKVLYLEGGISKKDYTSALANADAMEAELASVNYSISALESKLEDTQYIKSPISGIIVAVHVSSGDTVMPRTPLVEVGDLNNLYIEGRFSMNEEGLIQEGCSVEIPAFKDSKYAVRKVLPKAKATQGELGSIEKKIVVEISGDPIPSKIIGEELTIKMITAEKEDCLLIPYAAVVNREDKNFAYVVENGRVHIRQLEIGIKGRNFYEVIQGLKEGDRVVLSPPASLKDKSKVRA